MKISVLKTTLAKALAKAASVSGSRTTLPVLAHLLIDARNGKVTLVGTDLEVRVEVSLDAVVEREGATTLPSKKLQQIVALCNAETVVIDVNENHHARIEAGTARYTLFGLPPNDFPEAAEVAFIREWSMKQPDLAHFISLVSYAVNEEESRRILKGVLLSTRGGTLTAAATDGKRLALVEKTLEQFDGAEGDAVVPLRSIETVRALLEKQNDVKISASDKNVEFDFSFENNCHCRISCKLLEGTYPNLRTVIPNDTPISVQVPSRVFQSCLDRVMLAGGNDTPSVRLTFADNALKLETYSELIGDGSDSLPVAYSGNPLVLQMNTRYISEPFKHAQAEEITFKMSDSNKPVLLESTEGFIAVIMPIRAHQNAPAPQA